MGRSALTKPFDLLLDCAGDGFGVLHYVIVGEMQHAVATHPLHAGDQVLTFQAIVGG